MHNELDQLFVIASAVLVLNSAVEGDLVVAHNYSHGRPLNKTSVHLCYPPGR